MPRHLDEALVWARKLADAYRAPVEVRPIVRQELAQYLFFRRTPYYKPRHSLTTHVL